MSNVIEFTIPLPPSSNMIWRACGSIKSGRSRVIKSDNYKKWIDVASILILSQKKKLKKITCTYELEIFLPINMRGDIDNRVKPINDLLQRCNIVDNDRNNIVLFVKKSALVKSGECLISIRPYLDISGDRNGTNA